MRLWDSRRLVFIDESGVKTNMTRLYGRAKKGMRANDSAPHGHWSVRTLISSVRTDGETACVSVDAATDAEIFQAYVRKILVPTLRPRDIVIMDNLASHKSLAVEEAIASAGARVEYLPPYSPDLNPIEKMWSKIKAHLRAAEARTSRTLHSAIRKAFDSVTPKDTESWFASCGYTISKTL